MTTAEQITEAQPTNGHAPTPRKPGAQPGNLNAAGPTPAKVGNINALKSGKYAFSTMGRAPKGLRHQFASLNALRRRLTDEVIQRFGSISTCQEALISTAIRHEAAAILATRWMKAEGDKLPFGERLAALKQIEASSQSRDKALRALRLDPAQHAAGAAADPHAVIRAAAAALDATQERPPASVDPGANGSDYEGGAL